METIIMYVLPILLMISEALSLIPKLKSNGLFQLLYNLIKWLTAKPQPEQITGGTDDEIQG